VRMLDGAFQNTAPPAPQGRPHWHRARWRKRTLWTLGSLALVRLVITQASTAVLGEQRSLNHVSLLVYNPCIVFILKAVPNCHQWHHRLILLESLTAVLITALVVVYPSLGPEQLSQHHIIRTQVAAYENLQEVAASVQMVTVQKALTRRHPEWQEKVKEHWSRAASPHINEDLLKSTDAAAIPKISRAQMVAVPTADAANTSATGRLITEEEFARRTTQDLEASAEKAGVDLSKERRQALTYAKMAWDGYAAMDAAEKKA
jgi:hypothetical protein